MAGTSPSPRKGDYVLTPSLRRKLKRPLGRLFQPTEVGGEEFLSLVARATLVVAVGDRVTETIQDAAGRPPDVFVVDGKEQRKAREVPRVAHGSTVKAANPAGRITKAALSAIKKAFAGRKPVMVLIDGEEDLLAIPALLEAPTGAVVFYGQPSRGVVAVVVDERSRASARKTMEGMST
ncbi:MAG TPA: GTP-dependent dephospho-CoA kinase family protein [Nitrososphaerales archaeon]|nr:GTP-dependent dephospho-CoA kinase family protein [Nitrososphaerales archaeon]HUK75004.1 GTP-dependent dephospho-CoA kinase family protein [Nitrososphaerales archaeon]